MLKISFGFHIIILGSGRTKPCLSINMRRWPVKNFSPFSRKPTRCLTKFEYTTTKSLPCSARFVPARCRRHRHRNNMVRVLNGRQHYLSLPQIGATFSSQLAIRPRLGGQPINGIVTVFTTPGGNHIVSFRFETPANILNRDNITSLH